MWEKKNQSHKKENASPFFKWTCCSLQDRWSGIFMQTSNKRYISTFNYRQTENTRETTSPGQKVFQMLL